MPKIVYKTKRFSAKHQGIIAIANGILAEYAEQGFILSLRQCYYQFVARGYLPNTQKSYKWLGSILGDARLAGEVDWSLLEDRTRNLAELQHFDGPQDAMDKLASWYHVDMWEDQPFRPEVWIEKDALSGVIRGVCQENDVPYFSCRGYTSLSEMWGASMRLRGHARGGQTPYIIHFGDHDPSGIDMSRDIVDRLATFMLDCDFKRVALTMDQVEEHQPPPNPAKVTDSRYEAYLKEYGGESWELDALEPATFRSLIEAELTGIRDDKAWNRSVVAKRQVKKQLEELAKDWNGVAENKKRLAEAENEVRLLTNRVKRLTKKKRKK